jgi:hypothetical protein
VVAENRYLQPDARPLIDRIIAGEEQAIDAREAARLPAVCRGGRPIDVAIIYRWGRRPCRGCLLESASIGGRWVTTAPAIARFLQLLNDRPVIAPTAAPPPMPAVARRAHANALRELARAGLK